MIYKLSIPVVLNDRFDRDAILAELRRAGATRVFLALGAPSMEREKRARDLARLRELVPFFKEAGLEVGIWFWAFWRTDIPLGCDALMKKRNGDQRITNKPTDCAKLSGFSGFCCPESARFAEDSMELIREYASCDPDILMFDDDYRYGFFDSTVGCYCDNHMRMYSERLGREVTREELHGRVFADTPTEERRVFFECLGESMEHFAKRVRATVDAVNPRIRFAACSVMSLWDTDGTDSIRIAKLLAGGTRPLLRLIGAPYWAEGRIWNGSRLQNVIELERMEQHWCEDEDIEIMTEGDVYPRPRHKVPSAYSEGFDTALRAAGVGEGILKYMIDYTSSPTYEKGYVNAHLRNTPIYDAIARAFGDKQPCGVGVYEAMKKAADMDLSGIEERDLYVRDSFFSSAAKLLADNTVPITYGEDAEVFAVLGENARALPENIRKKHLILDVRAAKILTEQGIDVGLERVGESILPDLLCYVDQNEYLPSDYGAHSAYAITPRDGARVVIRSQGGAEEYVDAYAYENADRQRFLVFAFDAAFWGAHRFRSYAMQKLLYCEIETMTGGVLPAKCVGNPDLYLLTKRGADRSLAVGLWNFFADECMNTTVELDREYHEIEWVNGTGRLIGNRVELDVVAPYAFVGFCLK